MTSTSFLRCAIIAVMAVRPTLQAMESIAQSSFKIAGAVEVKEGESQDGTMKAMMRKRRRGGRTAGQTHIDDTKQQNLRIRGSTSMHTTNANRADHFAEGVEVLHARGHIQVNKTLLTEGPRRLESCGKDCFDSAEIYFSVPLPLPDMQYYIVGWRPVVTQHLCPGGKQVELVHHMNVLTGTARVPLSDVYIGSHSNDAALQDITSEDNLQIVATYDRGATQYLLPDGFGIPTGKHLLLEYHLLIPQCWSFAGPAFETSGFDLFVTPHAPRNIAKLAGFQHDSMRVMPNSGLAHHVTTFTPDSSQFLFRSSVTSNKGHGVEQFQPARPEVIAAHLHTHNSFDSKYLEVLNPDGTLLFRSPEEPGGYGAREQSMQSLKSIGWPRLVFEPGQTWRMHCKKNTSALEHVILDGTSWGEEMCSVLFVVAGPDVHPGLPTILSNSGGRSSVLENVGPAHKGPHGSNGKVPCFLR